MQLSNMEKPATSARLSEVGADLEMCVIIVGATPLSAYFPDNSHLALPRNHDRSPIFLNIGPWRTLFSSSVLDTFQN